MSTTPPDMLRVRQWQAFISRQLAQGGSREQILHAMLQAHWSETEAAELIRATISKARRRAVVTMVGSAVFGLVAFSVSVASYEQARVAGGTYVIWWGGVLCGVVGFFYGLWKLTKAG